MANPLPAMAMLAAGFLALTATHALQQSWAREVGGAAQRGQSPATGDVPNGEAAARQCAIYHARFGGTRARLVMVMQADVANYVVIEVSKGSRVVPTVATAWLRGAFGGAEASWLGEFASPDGALAMAARLCPQSMRCRIGEENCGPGTLSLGAPRSL